MKSGKRYLALLLSTALLLSGVPAAGASVQMGGDAETVNKINPLSLQTFPLQVYSSLQNPGFENSDDQPSGWSLINGADVENGTASLETNTEGYVFRGAKALKLTYTGTGVYGVLSNPVAVIPGQKYRLNLHSRTDAGSFKAIVGFYDEAGTIISGSSKEYTATGSGWKHITTNTTGILPATAPENAAYATVSLIVVAGSTVYLDNLQFTELSSNRALVNGGFEEGMDPLTGEPVGYTSWEWGYGYYGTQEIVEDPVHSGSKSLKMITLKRQYSNNTIRTGLVSVVPGREYNFSVMVLTESGTQPYMSVEYYDENGASITSGKPENIHSTLTNTWESLGTNAFVPAGAAFASITVWQAGAAMAGVYYADDVSVRQAGNVEHPPYLQNPGFEGGLDSNGKIKNWTKYGTLNDVILSAEQKYEGGYSVRLAAENEGGNGLRSDPVKVEANQPYRAKMMLYNDIGTSEIYLEFWNEGSSRIGVKVEALSRTKVWTEVTVEAYAPENAVYATILIYQRSDVRGIVYADNGSLEKYAPQSEEVQEFVSVINGHPKVYFTENDIAGLKAKAQDDEKAAMGSSGKEIAGKLLAQADAYLAEGQINYNFSNVYGENTIAITIPSPPSNVDVNNLSPVPPSGYGVYPFWTSISRGLEDRMEVLSMAYILTDNEVYAQKAIGIARAMTTWGSWHDPKDSSLTTNLDTAHIMFGISTVYDLLYDKMTEVERTAIQTAMTGKGLEPLFADAKAKQDHNIQALRNAALGTGALSLMGDVGAAYTNKYLTRAMEYFNWYLEERKSSGNQEGFGYTAYAIENMIDTFEQFARVTGKKELVKDTWLNNELTKWVVSFSAPGSYTLAPVSNFDASTGFYQTFSVLANNGNGLAGWYLSRAKPGSEVLLTKQFLYLNKNMPVTAPGQTIGNTALVDSVGWGAMRTGWNPGDTLFGFVSNNTGLGHNHFDQNSFLMASNGQWLASDPGYSNFAYDKVWDFKSKLGHNTILVDWIEDTVAGTQVYKGGGSIEPKVLTSTYACMVGSAASAYGNLLSKYDRYAIMINHKEKPYFIVYDDLSSSQERTYTWSLFSNGWDNLLVDGNMINGNTSSQAGNSIEVRKGYGRLYAQFVSDDALQIDTGLYKATEGPYIHASNIAKAQNQNFLTVLNTFNSAISIPAPVFQPTAVMDEGTTGALSLGSALFRGEKGVGSEISWTFGVEKTAEYDIALVMPNSYIYGIYQASIDGRDIGNPYDGYATEVTMGNLNELGEMTLSEGEHTLTMTCKGTSVSGGDKFYTAVTNIVLKDIGLDPSMDQAVRVLEGYDTDSVLGARIAYTECEQDLVLFNRGAGAVSAAGIKMNAKSASILGISGNKFEGFGVTDATKLSYKEKVLLESEGHVSAAADYTTAETCSFELNSSAEQSIKLYVPYRAKTVMVDGQSALFTQKDDQVSVFIPTGRHSIVISRK